MATISSTIQLIDNMSATLNTIQTNINSVRDSLNSISGEQTSIDTFSWSTFLANAESAGEKMTKIGATMTAAITTPLVLLGKKLYGTATEYESAFAGVKKTNEATEAEYEQLYQGLLQIAETNPTGFVEAAGIMEMAGQLGVAKEELLGFTEAYIGLQESTNIQGAQGAEDISSFLNVTEKSTANIDRVGGVIVGLGNNFATTEQEILAMATQMGATADLAGFSSAEILAFSAALSSVGINAEAGGSAAGKLMKNMQLAAEVGGQAQEKIAGIHWIETDKTTGTETEVWLKDLVQNGLEFVNYLDTLKSAEKVDIASQLGMTVDSLQNMADNWLLFDQFSEVMGITGDEFLSGWNESPAQSLLAFFQGLGNLDPENGNSILSQLAEMDITEIRLSNLVAAMAGNADLFQAALAEAYKQYASDPEENAMTVEVEKRYETTESQNEMLGNKLENTMANFGENLIAAIQPALDKVNELLTAFNGLSETDQDAILTAFAIFAVGGPIVTAIGATVETIGKVGIAISTISTKLVGFFGTGGLSAILTNPVTWGIAAGGALLAFIAYLDSIPSKFETIAQGVKDIPITIDETSYNETISQIQQIQSALDNLKPGEVNVEYENTSAAVAYGYGTNEMFGTSLAYEAAKTNSAINQVASEYAEQMNTLQREMVNALAKGDTETADAKKVELDGLRSALDAEIESLKTTYSQKIAELFEGMASQYPEAASQLSGAVENYNVALDTYKILYNWDESAFASYEESQNAWAEQGMKTLESAFNAGLLDKYKDQFNEWFNFSELTEGVDYFNWDNMKASIENGDYNMQDLLSELYTDTAENLKNTLQTVSDNPILSTWLASIISDPGLTENLDVSQLSGALQGIIMALDFKNAIDTSEDPNDWGKSVSEGLANGITANAGLATTAGSTMGTDVISTIKNVLGVHSPSTYMIEAGLNMNEGLAQGISNNVSRATEAASSAGSQVISVTISTLVPPTVGIGMFFSIGLASGILAGKSTVISAAVSVATESLNAAKSALGISSPSKETYYQGEMMIQGYVNALNKGASLVKRTVSSVVEGSSSRWNEGVWSIISSFASTESQALSDEFNNVEDAVTINDSDIEKIRTLAEREVINEFTVAEISVEMNNQNTINSDLDIDGIVTQLEDKIAEKLEVVAEGVYS